MKKKRQESKFWKVIFVLLLIPFIACGLLVGGIFFYFWYEEHNPYYIELDLELVGYPYDKSPWWLVTHSVRDFQTGKEWIVRYESSVCLESDCGTIEQSLNTFDEQFEKMNWVIDDNTGGGFTHCEYTIGEMEYWEDVGVVYGYRTYIPVEQADIWEDVTFACVAIYKSSEDSPYLDHILITVNPSTVARFNSGL